ncbi:NAD-dependent epimerase/dehydratase family protein [uncultured Pedobacter sp.]|uniref:NAD-dependent epimerase/dehydratase family protein n=1 Tax=uncultured Pedobacter sp. TaxID=246139 RepID=UPI0025D0962E|nr:NAD-dependent epimerase/dehydratase family protein [uncultured Pedobacter sp.]
MKEIKITGASGFVGKNLVNYLGKDYQVNTLSLRAVSNLIINPKDEVIIHLAGKAHDLQQVADPSAYYEVNYELTRKLYDAFLKSDAKKFIFISSVKAVADVVEGVLTEAESPKPLTHYGKSKLQAETYIQNQPLPQGKMYYILRPCMIHGPGNKGNLNLLYKFVKKGVPYPLAGFENKRSFLSVENLCFLISKLIENEAPSGVYNVADDEPVSTNEVVRILAASLNKQAKLWAISPTFIKSLAKFGDKFGLPLNTERLTKLTENYVVSNDKLKNALKINLPLATKEGLTLTASSFRN